MTGEEGAAAAGARVVLVATASSSGRRAACASPSRAAELTARVHAAMRAKALQDELRDAGAQLTGGSRTCAIACHRLRAGNLLGSWTAGRLLVLAPETGEPGALALGRALLGLAAGGAVPGAGIGVAEWRGDGREEFLDPGGAALDRARAAGGERLRAG